jgi:hydrogenase expression/formation protein HypC
MCLAIPGKVLEVTESEDPMFRTGRVSFAGIVKNVQLACTPEAGVGDYVLVHVGFAIAIVDEGEARRTLEMIGANAENASAIQNQVET